MKAGLDVELPWGLNYGQLENIVNTNGGLTAHDIVERGDAHPGAEVPLQRRQAVGRRRAGLAEDPATATAAISATASHVDLARKAASRAWSCSRTTTACCPSRPRTKVAVLGAKVPYARAGGSPTPARTVDFAKDVRTAISASSRVFPDPSAERGALRRDPRRRPRVTVMKGSSAADAVNADFIVVVAGLTAQDEGEEYTKAGDRHELRSRRQADRLQVRDHPERPDRRSAALGKPMVVVLEGGSVIDMPWLANVPAVVMAWYPGQLGGLALGKLLWGQANFSGKLPITWESLDDYGTSSHGTSTRFGFYVGYKLFDNKGITPSSPSATVSATRRSSTAICSSDAATWARGPSCRSP